MVPKTKGEAHSGATLVLVLGKALAFATKQSQSALVGHQRDSVCVENSFQVPYASKCIINAHKPGAIALLPLGT